MKTLITLAAALAATPALAQHAGHHGSASPESSEHGGSSHANHDSMDTRHDDHQSHQGSIPDTPPMDHSGHTGHQMDAAQPPGTHQGHDRDGHDAAIPQSGPPPEAFAGPEHAADTLFPRETMAEARAALLPELGGAMHRLFSIDRLEARLANGDDGYVWEFNAWYGGDIDKLWIKSEGEGEFGGSLEEAEIQALWSHAIGPYFDVQAGIRYDIRPNSVHHGPDRAHAVLGIQGLAPYFFEIDMAGFLSDAGDLTARIEAEYDQRITQRLILQPRIELSLAAQDIPEIGIGSGLSGLEAGLRLRYEVVPEFAPYIGVEWQRQFGATADFSRAAGGDPDRTVFLAGVKLWF